MKRKRAFFVAFLLLTVSVAFAVEILYPKPDSIVSTDISLQWSGATGTYYVYIGKSQSDLALVGSAESFSFKPKLLPDEAYWWSVVRKNTSGTFDYSPVSSFKTYPLSPTLIYPMNDSSEMATSVTFKWRGDGLFVVKLGLSADSLVKIGNTYENEISISDLDPNTRYFWQVIKQGKFASSKSAIFSFSTKPLSLSLIYPEDQSVDVATSVTFKWQAVPGQLYTLYVGTSTSSMKKVVSDFPLSSFKEVLSPLTTYYWQIVSQGLGYVKTYSKIAEFKTLPVLEVPSFPSPSSGSTGVPLNVLLSWKYQNGVNYDLYLGENPEYLYMMARSLGVSSYSPNGLEEDKWYYWRVESLLGNRQSFSPIWKFKTRKGTWHLIALNVSPEFPYVKDETIKLGRIFARAVILPSNGKVMFQVKLIEGPENGLKLFFGNEENFMKVAAGIPNVDALFYKTIKLGESESYESPFLPAGTYCLYIQNNVIYQQETIFGNITSQWEMPAQISYLIKEWY